MYICFFFFMFYERICLWKHTLLQVLGTFESVATIVKTTLTEALVQILSPKRRVDILRDAMEAKKQSRPYVMTFCGVNGVGKSTNLAKVNRIFIVVHIVSFLDSFDPKVFQWFNLLQVWLRLKYVIAQVVKITEDT